MFTVTPTFKGLLEAPGTTMEPGRYGGFAQRKPEPPIPTLTVLPTSWCLSSRYRQLNVVAPAPMVARSAHCDRDGLVRNRSALRQ